MSNVKFKTIEILESAIGEEIPKKQAKNYYKSAPKSLRQKIENAIIEADKDINDKAKFDGTAVLRDYRDNKLTPKQIADIFLQVIVDTSIQSVVQEFDLSWLEASERLAVQGVLTALVSEAVEEGLKTVSGKQADLNMDDLVTNLLTKLTSESEDPFNGLININEVVNGGKIKKGEGYDHLLKFTPQQMINYQNVSSLY